MSLDQLNDRVTSVNELEPLLGSPRKLVISKQLSELDHHMQAFVAEAPFALLVTYGHDGRCDLSPRGEIPAVAQVLDSKTLVLAERHGNRRADSLQKIIATGRVGLLFVISGLGETLRVNDSACVFRDEEVLASLAVRGRRPVIGIAVVLDEYYFQCAKALIRPKLWEIPQPLKAPGLASFARLLIDQTNIDKSVEFRIRAQNA